VRLAGGLAFIPRLADVQAVYSTKQLVHATLCSWARDSIAGEVYLISGVKFRAKLQNRQLIQFYSPSCKDHSGLCCPCLGINRVWVLAKKGAVLLFDLSIKTPNFSYVPVETKW
jgi:hypothetical protein